MRIIIFGLFIILGYFQTAFAIEATVADLKGDVRVRRGVEETQKPAGKGARLRDIDTIITGEAAEVLLALDDGRSFRLSANSMIDISDLRLISDRELFLFLTRQKLRRIERRDAPTRLQVTDVSVVHGANRDSTMSPPTPATYDEGWQQEFNGARALLAQDLPANTVVKLHKMMNRYRIVEDCGETQYYLGCSFDRLQQTGQAIDAFQASLSESRDGDCTPQWLSEARERLSELEAQK